MDKRGFRALGKALRQEAFYNTKDFENRVFALFLKTDIYKKAKGIMVYIGINQEAPTKNLIEKMLKDGKRIFVPVTRKEGLLASEIFLDTKYIKGTFSTSEPKVIKEIKKDAIDAFLIPGLLFSEKGERCGYGGGYYDRFLEDARGEKIGLAFSKQVIKGFPAESFDVKMDFILTEKGLINCEKQ